MSRIRECLLSINEWRVSTLFEDFLHLIDEFDLSLSFVKKKISKKDVVIVDCFLMQRVWMRIIVHKDYMRIRVNGAYKKALKRRLYNMNAKRVTKKPSFVAFSINEESSLKRMKRIILHMYKEHMHKVFKKGKRELVRLAREWARQ
jgi:hypothetical protein